MLMRQNILLLALVLFTASTFAVAPVVSTVTFTPNPLRISSSGMNCTFNVTDEDSADGNFTTNWYKNGANQTDLASGGSWANGSTITTGNGGTTYVRGDVWYCRIFVTDGTDTTEKNSSNVTVTSTQTINTVALSPTYLDRSVQNVSCIVNATSDVNTTMKFWYDVGIAPGTVFNNAYGYNLPNNTPTDVISLAMGLVNLSNTAPAVAKGDSIYCNVTVETPEGTDPSATFRSINYTINNFNTTVNQNITETPTAAQKVNLVAKFFDWDNDFSVNWANVTNGSCDFILASAVSNVNTVRFNCTIDAGKNMSVTISQNDTSGAIATTAAYVTDGPDICPVVWTAASTTLTADCYLNASGQGAFVSSGQTNDLLNCAGFSIVGDDSDGSVAVDIIGGSNITVKNCVIKNFNTGIKVEQGTNLSTFQNNTIGPTKLSGMLFENSNLNLVTGGEIKDANTGTPMGTGWEAGIALASGSSDNMITGVYMHRDRQGAIWIYEGSNNTHIQENNINDNCGFIRQIRCDDSTYTTVSNNNITNGTGMGLEMYNCDYATVDGNTITGNAYTGIALSGVDNGTFTSNVVSYNNGSGISMVSSTGNFFDGLTATSNEGWGIYVALGGTNEFDTILLTANEMGSIGLVNTADNEFYTVTSTGYPGEFNIYLANATDNYFHGLTATSTNIPTIDIRDGSTLNSFTEVNATATASQAVFINGASNSNQFILSSLRGNSTYGSTRVNGSQASYFIMTNFTAATGNDYNFYVSGHSNVGMIAANVFRGGTTLLGFSADSDNNTACLNDFNTTATYYVNDATAGGNHYVCTAINESAGNIYGDVLDGTVRIYGTVHAGLWFTNYYVGSSGTGYPYSALTSAKVVGMTDNAPLTLFLGTYAPTNSSTNALLSLIGLLVVVALLFVLIGMEVTIENLVVFMLLAIIVIQLMLPILGQGLVT